MVTTRSDYINNAIILLSEFGLIVPHNHLFIDGSIQRVATKTSKGQKDAWYCFHEIGKSGHIAGAYGEWRESGQTMKYKSWDGHVMTSDQRLNMDNAVKERFIEAERQKNHTLNESIKKSIQLWESAEMAGCHDYLDKKKISLNGARIADDAIIVPVHDIDFNIKGLQKIRIDSKKFQYGTAKKGNGFLIGSLLGANKLLFCEGFATGSSLHEATGLPVVVCFDAGNIGNVIESYKNKYPDIAVVICADNDQFKDTGNTGLDYANSFAEIYNAKVIVPFFANTENKPTDFNDLHIQEGINEVRDQIIGRVEMNIVDSVLPINYVGNMVTIIESNGSSINRSATMHGILSIIAHICAGQVATSTGENCNLFIANASRSTDTLSYVANGIDNIFRHLLNDDDAFGSVRTDRFTTAAQINKHFSINRTLLYLPDDIGGAVSKRNYQSSGALDSVIAKIKGLAQSNGFFSYVNDEGKKITLDRVSMGVYANIKENDFYHFAKTSDNGFLTLFITNVCHSSFFIANKLKRKGQISNVAHKQFIEHCQTLLNLSSHQLKPPSPCVLDFAYDPLHYHDSFYAMVDQYGAIEYKSYIETAYDNFKKLSAIIAYWNGSRDVISREIMSSCADYCIYRLKHLIDELAVKKTDDITNDVRTRVLDTIFKSREKGIKESVLVLSCSLYRKLSVDDRLSVIASLIMDGDIEERLNTGRGRPGKRFFMKGNVK